MSKLTREKIRNIMSEISAALENGHRVQAVRLIRGILPMSAVEALHYVKANHNKLEQIRGDLEEKAELSQSDDSLEAAEMVINNGTFRLEIMKRPVSREEFDAFIKEVSVALFKN